MNKILLIFLLLNFSVVFAFENVQIPGSSSYSETQSVISAEEYDALEKKIFKKTFSSDSAKNRLSRLEKEIFGMEQKGGEEERFENLITASDYYQSGYRQAQSRAQAQSKNKNEINPRDYIVNYNFENNENEDIQPKYAKNQTQYYYEDIEPVKKKSKVMQFFSDLADVLSAGVVTGYTLPMDSFDIDPFNGINTLGGTNYVGVPQFPTYYPQRYISPYRYNRPSYPYVSRYNRGYYPPRYRHHYTPHRNGINNTKTGSGVKIIY